MSYKAEISLPKELIEKGVMDFRVGNMQMSTFMYDSGVHGVKIENSRGWAILTPFQGMQTWHAKFDEKPLHMESLVKDPVLTKDYLEGYGAFLVHCGAHRIGCPAEGIDNHPLHGELPYADFKNVALRVDEDERGRFMALEGAAFIKIKPEDKERLYRANCSTKVYENSAVMDVSMQITNWTAEPMEHMYLEHANFRTVPGSTLVYSAPCTPETVSVRTKDPAHAPPSDKFKRFRQTIVENPALLNVIPEEKVYEPELVASLEYRAGADGWAHSMQVRPDGSADYISHKPSELPLAVRWMRTVSTPDPKFPPTNALGLCLPATSGVEGYAAEKQKGTVQTLAPHGLRTFNIRLGLLAPEEAAAMKGTIEDILR